MSIAIVEPSNAAAAQTPCLVCRGKGSIVLCNGAHVDCQLCTAAQTPSTDDIRHRLMGDARNALRALPALVHDLRAIESIADTVAVAIKDPFSPSAVAAAAQAWSPADPLVMEMRYANEAAQNRRKAAERTIGAARTATVNSIATQIGRILPAYHIHAPVPAWFGLEEGEYREVVAAMKGDMQTELHVLGTRWNKLKPPPPLCLDCEGDCPFCGGQGCPRYED